MPDIDLTVEMQACQVNREFLARQGLLKGRNRVYLVPYPRSGNTPVREYFSILQGRRSCLSRLAQDVHCAVRITVAVEPIPMSRQSCHGGRTAFHHGPKMRTLEAIESTSGPLDVHPSITRPSADARFTGISGEIVGTPTA